MKIEAYGGGVDAVRGRALREGTGGRQESFAELLSESLERSVVDVRVGGTVQVPDVRQISLERSGASDGNLWELGVKTLDSLERYQRRLADLTFPVNALTPLIDDVRAKRESLCESMEGAVMDEGFRGALGEVAALAGSEVERFMAGFYGDQTER